MAYAPSQVPEGVDERIARWLLDEVIKIQAALQSPETEALVINERFTEPSRLKRGMIVYADGANWNPGGGAGLYEYTGGGTNGWRMLASGVQY